MLQLLVGITLMPPPNRSMAGIGHEPTRFPEEADKREAWDA